MEPASRLSTEHHRPFLSDRVSVPAIAGVLVCLRECEHAAADIADVSPKKGAQPYLRAVPSEGVEAGSKDATRGVDEARHADAAMGRYARGDAQAFAALYRLIAPRLLRHCVRLVGPADAEELAQEVFLKIHRARGSFVDGARVLPWAHAIARRSAADHRRRRRPEYSTEPVWLELRQEAEAACPESSYRERVLDASLTTELARMSDTLREAFLLVKREGMTCAEAGDALGTSPEAVKKRVQRAVSELKHGLGATGLMWTATSGHVEKTA